MAAVAHLFRLQWRIHSGPTATRATPEPTRAAVTECACASAQVRSENSVVLLCRNTAPSAPGLRELRRVPRRSAPRRAQARGRALPAGWAEGFRQRLL